MVGIALGTGDKAVNVTDTVSVLREFRVLRRRQISLNRKLQVIR